jgi:hypothetical protein
VAISDTSPEIEAMQLQIRRSMSPAQRFDLALEMSDFCRELRKAGIRRDHPDWSELEVMHEILRQAFRPGPIPEWVERRMAQAVQEQRARQAAGLE